MVLLDRSTLMVVFAVMTLTMLVLFYFDTYRKSRAPFAGWWCGAVASFFFAAVLYFLGEVQAIGWAPSAGNGVMVLGSGCVWAGTRSLAGRRVRPVLFGFPATAAVAVDAVVRNSDNARLGSVVLLALMGTAIGLASVELWRERAESWHLVRSLAVATAGCAAYYLSRTVGLAVLGPAITVDLQLMLGWTPRSGLRLPPGAVDLQAVAKDLRELLRVIDIEMGKSGEAEPPPARPRGLRVSGRRAGSPAGSP